MTQRITAQRFRQRKLSTKQNLAILRENDIEKTSAEDDAQRNIPKIETGVEKGEEIEHHLQAIISAAQAPSSVAKHLFIPTPEVITTKESGLNYERLYTARFTLPKTYIRFSSTVEDCVGSLYCMTSEDEDFLRILNQKKAKSSQCTEDQFEEVMSFFEETAQQKQPFAAVDNAPVIPYAEMEASFDETISLLARQSAREIYEHWRVLRLRGGNRGLMPVLKFETNLETDDSDPYVCFRRREVRQVRKTRGRDAQVAEKLKKLRREMEDARQLLRLVLQREHGRRDLLAVDRLIFERRHSVKEVKRNLNIKGDDEDLINQKPSPKPKPKMDPSQVQRGIPGMNARPPLARMDGRPVDSDLVMLDDMIETSKVNIQKFVESNVQRHREWNRGWVDGTWRPITPPLEEPAKPRYRAAVAEYLPTPPASTSSEQSGESMDVDEEESGTTAGPVAVRYASPPYKPNSQNNFSYRRRRGRGGRLMIDRRSRKRPLCEDVEERIADRWKYDRDSDEDEDVYFVDPHDNMNIRYRILLDKSTPDPMQALQQRKAAAMAAAAAAAADPKNTSPQALVARAQIQNIQNLHAQYYRSAR